MSCAREWCHAGQYRHRENNNWRTNPDAIRYGYTSDEKPPHLWGGFAQHVLLAVERGGASCAEGRLTPELAGLVTPMANGVEWSLFDGRVGYTDGADPGDWPAGPVGDQIRAASRQAALIIVTGIAEGCGAARCGQEALAPDYA